MIIMEAYVCLFVSMSRLCLLLGLGCGARFAVYCRADRICFGPDLYYWLCKGLVLDY
jgi:hypothetical protein